MINRTSDHCDGSVGFAISAIRPPIERTGFPHERAAALMPPQGGVRSQGASVENQTVLLRERAGDAPYRELAWRFSASKNR